MSMEKKHHALPLSRISGRIYYCTLDHHQTSTREYKVCPWSFYIHVVHWCRA